MKKENGDKMANEDMKKNCEECGKEIYAYGPCRFEEKRFCSHRCQGTNEHRLALDEQRALNIKCQQCGVVMTAISVKTLKQKRFCSHSCCAKYMSSNKISGIIGKGDTHSEATRAKFREIGKSRDMSKMCKPEVVQAWLRARGQSPQEATLDQWLQEANLPYKFVGDGQLCIAGYWPDFVNTEGKRIVIEFSEYARNSTKWAVYIALGYMTVWIPRYHMSYGMKETVINRVRAVENKYDEICGKYVEEHLGEQL